MKSLVMVGVLLIAAGAAGLIFKSFSYESQETVAKIGSLEANAEITKEVEVPQALSLIVIAAGAALLIIGLKK